ncbi:DsrE family protein [Saccharopolyspora sp. SCSIO 74807]|uniref:DsrE family protein n=1 Tax=Saccharopolyspora sp. SCSIO 74807 TaxID=3118084 RepID=UPI0030D46C3A
MSVYQVVFQVPRDGAEFHETVVRNVRNVAAELGDVAIRVIAHGDGIEFATGRTAAASGVRAALDAGVEVLACQNTLRRKEIPETEVLSGVRLVRAGLAELVRLQHDGWAYVHP